LTNIHFCVLCDVESPPYIDPHATQASAWGTPRPPPPEAAHTGETAMTKTPTTTIAAAILMMFVTLFVCMLPITATAEEQTTCTVGVDPENGFYVHGGDDRGYKVVIYRHE
jgi:hypothetical protein